MAEVDPEATLIQRFGKHGAALARHAQGVDEQVLQVEHAVKSLSKERTFAQDVHDEIVLRQTLGKQAAEVASALQHEGLRGATIALKLRWPDFTMLTRQATLPAPTNQEAVIAGTSLQLFSQIWHAGLPVRLVGVGVSGLSAAGEQRSLWDSVAPLEEKRQLLEATLERLRARFGEEIVRWGNEWKQAQ